jgi:hypothetical protein
MAACAMHIQRPKEWGARQKHQFEGQGGKESGSDDDEPDGSAPPPALHGKRDGGSEHQWQDDGLVGKVSQISHARPYRLRVLKNGS